MWDSIYVLLHQQHDAIDLLAALIAIGTPIWALGVAAILKLRQRAKNTEALNKRLENQNASLNDEVVTLEQTLKDIQGRLPSTVLRDIDKYQANGKPADAVALFDSWIGSNGAEISSLLVRRAEQVLVTPDVERPKRMSAAEAYVIAALAFCPTNISAAGLLEDFQGFRKNERASRYPWSSSLYQVSNLSNLIDVDPFERTDLLQAEADQLADAGLHHLALPLISRVVDLRERTSKDSLATCVALRIKAVILEALGNWDLAFETAQTVCVRARMNPDIGWKHPEALRGSCILARVFQKTGQLSRALPLFHAVWSMEAANPELGPPHPDTLYTRYCMASTLFEMGLLPQALHIAENVQRSAKKIGSKHPTSFANAHLIGTLHWLLGEPEKGLAEVRSAVGIMENVFREFGPNHEQVIEAKIVIPSILCSLGRAHEALPIAKANLAAAQANPTFNEIHPVVLQANIALAVTLSSVDRKLEALGLVLETISAFERNDALREWTRTKNTLLKLREELQLELTIEIITRQP